MPQIVLELDEDDYVLAQFLAEVNEVTVEQAARDALMDSVRRLYESRTESRGSDRRDDSDKDDELIFEE